MGLPLRLDGSLGSQAEKVLAFVERLRRVLRVPVVTRDERLTSVEADERLREAGVRGRDAQGAPRPGGRGPDPPGAPRRAQGRGRGGARVSRDAAAAPRAGRAARGRARVRAAPPRCSALVAARERRRRGVAATRSRSRRSRRARPPVRLVVAPGRERRGDRAGSSTPSAWCATRSCSGCSRGRRQGLRAAQGRRVRALGAAVPRGDPGRARARRRRAARPDRPRGAQPRRDRRARGRRGARPRRRSWRPPATRRPCATSIPWPTTSRATCSRTPTTCRSRRRLRGRSCGACRSASAR